MSKKQVAPTLDEDAYKKAAIAEGWVKHPLWKEMFGHIEAQYVGQWKQAKDAEARESLWYQLQALRDVNTAFNVLVEKKELQDLANAEDEE